MKPNLAVLFFLVLLAIPLASAGLGETYNKLTEGPDSLFTLAGQERQCEGYPYFAVKDIYNVVTQKYMSLNTFKMLTCPADKNGNPVPEALINLYSYNADQNSVKFVGEYESPSSVFVGYPYGVYWECYRCPSVKETTCTAGTKECITEAVPRVCSSSGTWTALPACAAGQRCSRGSCESLPCTPAWTCTAWSDCSTAGSQVRTCRDTAACGVLTDKPATYQKCTYVASEDPVCTFTYSDSMCSPCEPRASADCTPLSICSDGEKSCIDGFKATCLSNTWQAESEACESDSDVQAHPIRLSVIALVIFLISALVTLVLSIKGSEYWWVPTIPMLVSLAWLVVVMVW